ncbi:Dynein heavy chain 5, axonemal [Trichoplax sp. H2]|nr:Dynein heavy chain 5, axonemal [Trichoplax sp. H2]|eukprot:RDD45872.1 Dynein heavy chain 5, axonemal [Trichoplax sp. H2]
MDDRHWWFATKLQASFRIGGYDKPTLLEDFICESSTLEHIGNFLGPNGVSVLFFYCEKLDETRLSSRRLHVSYTVHKDIDFNDMLILYFLRDSNDEEILPHNIADEVCCGELSSAIIASLQTLLSDSYAPLLRVRKDWGQCSEDNISQLFTNFDKLITALIDSADILSSNKYMLKRPEASVTNDFKLNRAAVVNQTIVSEFEILVADWISTIETVLQNQGDDSGVDTNAGPLSELYRWRRRHKIFTNITDQLKGKECKAVISVLITAKSKLLKRWKNIDVCITEAVNETKDKVKYLESLKKYIDQLYHNNSPTQIASNVLPMLFNNIRQMDSISRAYARSGYLGLFLSKICNQMVALCKEYISGISLNEIEIDYEHWKNLEDLKKIYDDPRASGKKQAGHKSATISTTENQDMLDKYLPHRLLACLALAKSIRDSIRNLRDSLGTAAFSTVSSASHLSSMQNQHNQNATPAKWKSSGQSLNTALNIVKRLNSVSEGGTPSNQMPNSIGVSLNDEDSIMFHFDRFCIRVRHIIGIIQTLAQFSQLASLTTGLPRLHKQFNVSASIWGEQGVYGHCITILHTGKESVAAVGLAYRHVPAPHQITSVVEEEEDDNNSERLSTHGQSNPLGRIKVTIPDSEAGKIESADGSLDDEPTESTEEDQDFEEELSITGTIKTVIKFAKKLLRDTVTTEVLLDVDSMYRERFDKAYEHVMAMIKHLEQYVAKYIETVMSKKITTQHALDILTRFNTVQNRMHISTMLKEKFYEAFNWYEEELEEVQDLYEKNKEEPHIVRHAPPVAGAINWIRQLLRRLEEPMKIFCDTKSVMADSTRVIKNYNRIASTLIKFESLWFSQWKAHIDSAKHGLKVPLLLRHPKTGDLIVNADERVSQVIHEGRWMARLNIQLPENAVAILSQESRFKKYKHNLEAVLHEFKRVCQDIPLPLQPLFEKHTETVMRYLLPGLSTVTWNSMNIDAYLHHIHTSTNHLKEIVVKVNNILISRVDCGIASVKNAILFDMDSMFSEEWSIIAFPKLQIKNIEARKQELLSKIYEVESALRDIVNIITENNINSQPSLQYQVNGKGVISQLTKSINKNLQSQSLQDRNKSSNSSSSAPNYKIGPFNTKSSNMFEHYGKLMHDAILHSISKSLFTYAEALGCKINFVKHPTQLNGDAIDNFGNLNKVPTVIIKDEASNQEDMVLKLDNASQIVAYSGAELKNEALLRFNVDIKFSIPDLVVEPKLEDVQTAVNQVAHAIIAISQDIKWTTTQHEENALAFNLISNDKIVTGITKLISSTIRSYQQTVRDKLNSFRRFNFLWANDIHATFNQFVKSGISTSDCMSEVERLQRIEREVEDIDDKIVVGAISLGTLPVRNSLRGFAAAWKVQYASYMHDKAKGELDKIIAYRMHITDRLAKDVFTLDQLNEAQKLLQELSDMENTIDDVFLPVERMYSLLRQFNLRLPRSEVQEVRNLREEWQKLLLLAEKVRYQLMVTHRTAFEQELDKQIKAFVVDVIQFRNSFDAQGPAIPGIRPAEAVKRLIEFQDEFQKYDEKRRILDAVQKLFGKPPVSFPDLDKTGEELHLLDLLYSLFQRFLAFDAEFRERLWAKADLDNAHRQMEVFWNECLKLPEQIKGWSSYKELKGLIDGYLALFPVLHRLASKEIRNRHWLDVMVATGSSFQLEANVFKLKHLLDIGLLRHQNEIGEITRCASRELEIEETLRNIEEEWTEQVLAFDEFKNRGFLCLSASNTQTLLEQLDDSQVSLASMLTSRHIGPLRDEAASWATKLNSVSEILELWLSVQELWLNLEAVFYQAETIKELPQEARRFNRIDRSWSRLMKQAYEIRNVLQCCFRGDVPKYTVLKHLLEELELCFKSLLSYLDQKRREFPRFYFVSDSILLSVLRSARTLDSVRPHLRSIFGNISNLKINTAAPISRNKKVLAPLDHQSEHSNAPSAATFRKRSSMDFIPISLKRRSSQDMINIPFHRSSQNAISSGVSIANSVSDADGLSDSISKIYAVVSPECETLQLSTQVPLSGGVQAWLNALSTSVEKTLLELINDQVDDVLAMTSIDEWAYKYPAQVARLGLQYYWTKECEQGITEIRTERKSLSNTSRRFWSFLSKTTVTISRVNWKHVDEPVTNVHRLRLETLLAHGLYMRDVLDDLAKKKLREQTDFEWKKNLRFYHMKEDSHKEEKVPQIWVLDTKFNYGFEFYGCMSPIIMTPLTDRCFLSLSQAVSNHRGAALCGPWGTGKTETIKGFAHMLGVYLVAFSCSLQSEPSSLIRIIHGLAQDGCWGCFDDFHRVQVSTISVLSHHLQIIMNALRTKEIFCTMPGGIEITINRKVAFFMTYDTSYGNQGDHLLPSDIRTLFRPIALTAPDVGLILRAYCTSKGFKAPRVLADRIKLLLSISKHLVKSNNQHKISLSSILSCISYAAKRRDDYQALQNNPKMGDIARSNSASSTQNLGASGGGLRPRAETTRKNTPSQQLSPAIRGEHMFVSHAIQDLIVPQISPENFAVFNSLLHDIFYSSSDPYKLAGFHDGSGTVEEAFMQQTQKSGLHFHAPWVSKAMQLHKLSKVHHGVVVAGPPGSGKSTMISTLIDALSLCSKNDQGDGSKKHIHRLQKINPTAVSNLSLMFGRLNASNDWEDGIFTALWRKANKNLATTTWLCLDATLAPYWADNLNCIIGNGRSLDLLNGERLFLSDNVKILFETHDVSNASPAVFGRTGIVYVDDGVLGWVPLSHAWLASRNDQEIKVLQPVFSAIISDVTNFISYDCQVMVKVCEIGLFQTCLSLLTALLEEQAEVIADLHIERLFLFSVIWSYGMIMNDHDRGRFSNLMKSLSTALPDYDLGISVFDYYVDESGEWDPWTSRVPEFSPDSMDFLGETFIDTVTTVKISRLMELSFSSGRNVSIIGPPGCGKTVTVNRFLDQQDGSSMVTKRIVFSGTSSAHDLQHFIDENVYHRQGFVYGAKDGKKLCLFVDDLNLPTSNSDKTIQESHELLRQLLDDKLIFNYNKIGDYRVIENLQVIATATSSSSSTINTTTSTMKSVLPDRLKRHFSIFYLQEPTGNALNSIMSGIVHANLYLYESVLNPDLMNTLTQASCDVLARIKSVLRPSPVPGRYQYSFNLRDLNRVIQMLKRLSNQPRIDELSIVSLWKHELDRTIRDRICRNTDLNWYDGTVVKILEEYFPDISKDELIQDYITFKLEPIRSRTHTGATVKDYIQPITNMSEIMGWIRDQMITYNEDFGNRNLSVILSDYIVAHVVRLLRILSFNNRGNAVLVGQVGSHLSTYVRFALYVCGIPQHHVDTSSGNTFYDGLRSAVRLTGAEGKRLAIVLKANDLKNSVIIDAVNSILISGECSKLFSNDELDGLLQALSHTLKRNYSNMDTNPMDFFISRVKSNLHIIITIPPTNNLLKVAANQFPGFISCCHMDWLMDWSKPSLISEATHYIAEYSIMEHSAEDIRGKVVHSMADIHVFMLKECDQLPWAMDKYNANQSNDPKQCLPFAKNALVERITTKYDKKWQNRKDVFVGPNTYRRFMNAFKKIYTTKHQEANTTILKLRKALQTLESTKIEAESTASDIEKMKYNLRLATDRSASLLQQLTIRITQLEKLKAKLGTGGNVLDAFATINELEMASEVESVPLPLDDEMDELDTEFEKLRQIKLRKKHDKLMEDITRAQEEVDEAKKALSGAKNQIRHWRNKIDRSCVERLRVFQNPPSLVGTVMEMTMVLLGKLEPSPAYSINYNTSSSNIASNTGNNYDDAYSSIPRGSSFVGKSKRGRDHTNNASNHNRVDRDLWKSIQLAMTDSQKFIDALWNIQWEEGLSPDKLAIMENYLGKKSPTNLAQTNNQLTGLSITEEMNQNHHHHHPITSNLLASGSTFSPRRLSSSTSVSFQTGTQQTGAVPPPNITIAAAKYSSEDAAILVAYIMALVEYTYQYSPVREKIERLQELLIEKDEDERRAAEEEDEVEQEEEQREEIQIEDELSIDDYDRIEEEAHQLQIEYDRAAVEKHILQKEYDINTQRLQAAMEAINSLETQTKLWQDLVDENTSLDLLLANCVCASAFLAYLGPLGADARSNCAAEFMRACMRNKLPVAKKAIFTDVTLAEFVLGQANLRRIEVSERLPKDILSQENFCIFKYQVYCNSWILLCDPQRIASTYVAANVDDITIVRYKELRNQLDTCLNDGKEILITDVDTKSILEDKRFSILLRHADLFDKERETFKMMIGDHEVECNPQFRMTLSTSCLPMNVPDELASQLSVIELSHSTQGLEELLLDFFMQKEKTRIDEDSTQIAEEMIAIYNRLETIEQNMLELLSCNNKLLHDLTMTKKLTSLKKAYDEAIENQARVKVNEDNIINTRQHYRPVAKRGAVLFNVSKQMALVNPMYQISLDQFLNMYSTSILHSDRTVVKAVVDRLTQLVFFSIARGYFEIDQFLYALHLAIEVEGSEGRVGNLEREYLISPTLANQLMMAQGKPAVSDLPPSKHMGKKPFEWMSDDQYQNLLTLASYYDWFTDYFERMTRDGRETQWRALCEHLTPENAALPDIIEDRLKPMQKLLILRAIRPDRLLQTTAAFVVSVLGKRYVGEVACDLTTSYKQGNNRQPMLLVFSSEAETAERLVYDFSVKRGIPLVNYNMCDSIAEESRINKAVQRGMLNGQWVMLHNAHYAPHLLNTLNTILSDTKQIDPSFRLWISSKPNTILSHQLLQSSIKLVVEPPKRMRESILSCLNWIEPDTFKTSQRSEWIPLLHNLCLLHSSLRLRTRYKNRGWNAPYDLEWSNSEFWQAIEFFRREFANIGVLESSGGATGVKNITWTGLRTMLSEVIYGNIIFDKFDQATLNAIVEKWINSGAIKRDSEPMKVKYRAPAIIFSPNVRMSAIAQAMENVNHSILDVPEACGLHSSSEVALDEGPYLFYMLSKIIHDMPDIGNRKWNQDQQVATSDKTITVNQALAIPHNTNAQPLHTAYSDLDIIISSTFIPGRRSRYVDIHEIAINLLSKLPKGWTREFIHERIKKKKGSIHSPFNQFVLSEVELMNKLIQQIRLTLTSLKEATQHDLLGDHTNDDALRAASDLYYLRIPEDWCKLGGPSAPPHHWNLGYWIDDFNKRFQHLDRMLLQDTIRAHYKHGIAEEYVLQIELTARDKDHLRDAPNEGMFVYGIYVWGSSWEKTAGELQDAAPKSNPSSLPVIHITAVPISDKPWITDPSSYPSVYQCPCYCSRMNRVEPLFCLDIKNDSGGSRWALRGLYATLRPF